GGQRRGGTRAHRSHRRLRQRHDRRGSVHLPGGAPHRCAHRAGPHRGLHVPAVRRLPRPCRVRAHPQEPSMNASRSALRQLLVASRPVSWINTAYPFAAAYLLTARGIDLPLVIGTLFFLVPYNLAMYGINDVFDYESDLRNPRKGGAHGAVLDRRLHRATLWAAGLSCLPFVVYLAIIGDPLSLLVLALSLFFVVFYSAPPLRLKEVPFADSATSAVHFVSPAVYGLVLAGAVWTWQLGLIMLAFALWGVASH